MRRLFTVAIVALVVAVSGGGAYWWVSAPRKVSTAGQEAGLYFYSNQPGTRVSMRFGMGRTEFSELTIAELKFSEVSDPDRFRWILVGIGSQKFEYANIMNQDKGNSFLATSSNYLRDCNIPGAATAQRSLLRSNNLEPAPISIIWGTMNSTRRIGVETFDVVESWGPNSGPWPNLRMVNQRPLKTRFDTTRYFFGAGSVAPRLGNGGGTTCVALPISDGKIMDFYPPATRPSVTLGTSINMMSSDREERFGSTDPKPDNDSSPNAYSWSNSPEGKSRNADSGYVVARVDFIDDERTFLAGVVVLLVGVAGGVVAALIIWLAGVGRRPD